jgi:hypothetical protein
MALIKIDKIVDHLNAEMRKALKETIQKHFPQQAYPIQPHQEREILRTFKNSLARKCNHWPYVPDAYIDIEPEDEPAEIEGNWL